MPPKAVNQSLPHRRAQQQIETLADEAAVQIGEVVDLAYSHADYRQLEEAAQVLFCLSACIAVAAHQLEAGMAE